MKGSPETHAQFLAAARLARAVDIVLLNDTDYEDIRLGFSAVAWCTDIVPDDVAAELGLATGINYARAAQILRPPSRKPRKLRKRRSAN